MDKTLELVNTISSEISDSLKRKASETFNLFIKTVKAVLVYPSSSKLPQQFKEELFNAITALTAELETVPFTVEADRILLGDHEVYRASNKTDNFAHTFFRDGIQDFQFKRGISQKEIDSFVEIITRMLRSASVDDDMATLLWEAGLENITYTVMDDILDIQTFEYGPENLRKGTAPSRQDIDGILSKEIDLELSDEDYDIDSQKKKAAKKSSPYGNVPDPINEFIRKVAEFTDEEQAAINQLMNSDNEFDYKKYTIDLLFEILGQETDNAGFQETLELIAKVRDDFIRAAEFLPASMIFERTLELEQGFRNLKDPKVEKIQAFIETFASSSKIKIITEALNGTKEINYNDAIEYLKLLPWQAINPLMVALGEIQHYPGRRAVCKALEVIAADKIDILAKGLEDSRWYVVRNIVVVLGKINNPKALTYLKKTIRHPELRVRKETVVSAARIGSEEAADFLVLALKDDDEKLQRLALNELVKQKHAKAFGSIEFMVTDRKFKDRPPEQIRELLEAYAQLGGKKAFELLEKLATQKFLVASEKQERVRDFAIRALGLTLHPAANELLQKLMDSRNKTIAESARRTLARATKGSVHEQQ